jgi:hypothetical protein
VRAWVRWVVLLSLIAGCTNSTVTKTPHGASYEARATSAVSSGHLALNISRRCCYTEGSFLYLKISTGAGVEILHRIYTAAEREIVLREPLPPGTYSLVTYERGCVALCPKRGQSGGLDPPTSRCQRSFMIESRTEHQLRIVSGPTITHCGAH